MISEFSKTIPTVKYTTLECFCEMTQSAYAPYVVDVSEVLHSSDGWTSLADLWEELIDETGKDIFADVLHLIKWGAPFRKDSPLAYQKLVLAICEALQSNSPAFYAWTSHYFFKCCIDGITEVHFDSKWYPHVSSEHYHFLTSLTTLKIWKYIPGHITACNNAACNIARYKSRIIKLLPHARHWQQDDWLDESNIFREILHIYNLDFSCNLTAYGVLHQLLDSPTAIPEKIDAPAINSLIRLDLCSPELIATIWPLNNANIITKLFLLAEKTACYWFDVFSNEVCDKDGWRPTDSRYTCLRQSWLFAYICQQLYSEKISHRYVSKVKRAVLNIELHSNR